METSDAGYRGGVAKGPDVPPKHAAGGRQARALVVWTRSTGGMTVLGEAPLTHSGPSRSEILSQGGRDRAFGPLADLSSPCTTHCRHPAAFEQKPKIVLGVGSALVTSRNLCCHPVSVGPSSPQSQHAWGGPELQDFQRRQPPSAAPCIHARLRVRCVVVPHNEGEGRPAPGGPQLPMS